MEYHEIANIFPLMEGTELTELSADIKKNGLIDPIWLYENKILDGRNRYRACQEVGVEPRFQSYPGNDPLQQVISLNLHRRHLNESQRAVVAARLANITRESTLMQGSRSADLPIGAISQSQAAKMLNVSERMVRTVRAIERQAPERLSEINSGKETATKIYKLIKRAEPPAEPLPLPLGIYNVIYADPPWKYDFSETTTREIENQYSTMSLDEIKAIPIPADENSVLFLWATAPKLLEAIEVMQAWGYQYKSNAVWDKKIIGLGYWFRGQHELLLVGTKGHFSPPAQELRISSVIESKRTKHSKKPDLIYETLEKMFPAGKFLEMFARDSRDKWTSWGNEC